MKKLPAHLFVIAIALLFTLLFYHESVGLNLLLFEAILVPLAMIRTGRSPSTPVGFILTAGVAVTAFFTLLHGSAFVITMNILTLFLWSGWLWLPRARSMASALANALARTVRIPLFAISDLFDRGTKSTKVYYWIKQLAYLILPGMVILFFLMLYGGASPWFSGILEKAGIHLEAWLEYLFNHIDVALVFLLFFGYLAGVLFFLGKENRTITEWDHQASDDLLRIRRKRPALLHGTLALLTEMRAGIILLIVLNALILLQNILDIRHVWFGFEWNGQYLRQFVHEGTWLLIISILLSILILLWLYRGNLNFIPGNRWLKTLSYAWLLQNGILLISVAIRNSWYVWYFALAYKRIGVFIFLAITLAGIITVFAKIHQRKSMFYLLRTNLLITFMVLIVTSCINWDSLIARFNFSRYDRSFVHLDWMCTLSDKTLPLLDKSTEEMNVISQAQKKAFSFKTEYMTPEAYLQKIEERKSAFLNEWPARGILSYTIADHRAYLALKKKQH
jgi:hypothetical protein